MGREVTLWFGSGLQASGFLSQGRLGSVEADLPELRPVPIAPRGDEVGVGSYKRRTYMGLSEN